VHDVGSGDRSVESVVFEGVSVTAFTFGVHGSDHGAVSVEDPGAVRVGSGSDPFIEESYFSCELEAVLGECVVEDGEHVGMGQVVAGVAVGVCGEGWQVIRSRIDTDGVGCVTVGLMY
jgi:hypothetical protein